MVQAIPREPFFLKDANQAGLTSSPPYLTLVPQNNTVQDYIYTMHDLWQGMPTDEPI